MSRKMKLHSIIVLWIILDLGKAENFTECIAENATKKASGDDPPRINVWTTSFKDLVENSDFVVDRSMLIQHVLKAGPLVSLTYPRKWGKSINLDMLKTFLELELDSEGNIIPWNSTWSYKYFVLGQKKSFSEYLSKAPLISTCQDTINEYLGKYGVIHIDLSGLQTKDGNVDICWKNFRRIVGETFKKHDYLIKLFREKIASLPVASKNRENMRKMLETFNLYKTGEIDDAEEMTKSLAFLSRVLYEHFGRQVFILIDGYDKIVRELFFSMSLESNIEEAKKFLDFYSKFISSTLVTNDILRGGVVTGVFNVDLCLINSPFRRFVNFNQLNKTVTLLHVFNEAVVKQMRKWISLKDKPKVMEQYCAYDSKNKATCDPWSLLNFAITKEVRNFRSEIENFEIIPEMADNKNIRELIVAILSGNNATIKSAHLQLRYEDVTELRNISRYISDSSSFANKTNLFNVVIGLCFSTGYLCSKTGFTLESKSKISLKITSKEKELIIVKTLINYYRWFLGYDVNDLAVVAADRLAESLDSNFGNQSKFLEALKCVYERCTFQKNCDVDYANLFILLHLRYRHNYNIGYKVIYGHDNDTEEHQIYMTVYGKGIGAIYDFMKLNTIRRMHEVWRRGRQLIDYEDFFSNKNIKLIRFMVIAYDMEHRCIGGLMMNEDYPFESLDAKNKCKESNWWSQGFGDFKDLPLKTAYRY